MSGPGARRKKLKQLEKALFKYRQEIRDAVASDFSKPAMDVDLSEIFVVLKEIRHARKLLRRWMAPRRVSTPLSLIGTHSKVISEPKGRVLIISPWNFPINLTFGPLVGAIASGNVVILKPSEYTPHSAAIMKKIISEIFDPGEVFLIEGGSGVAQKLCAMPFDHIFFTGSPETGKKVANAAIENHTTVTLELGGKSPALVDLSANVANAAKRIAWGKYVNGGQICIAPDFVMVHSKVYDRFVTALKKETEKLFGSDIVTSRDYCRMVSDRHFRHMASIVADAQERGASVHAAAEPDAQTRFYPPTILEGEMLGSTAMEMEIFGPVLPILKYDHIDEFYGLVRSMGKPLALYIFSSKRKFTEDVIRKTRAGTTAINECLLQFFHPELPFGGTNLSGSGKGHGHYGFLAFSNQRSVLKQSFRLNAFIIASPPYTSFKQKLVNIIIKWL